MEKDIEKRFKKYSKLKKEYENYLEIIKENKTICIDFIEKAIHKVKASEAKYLEGYTLSIDNEKRVPIEEDEEDGFFMQAKIKENINIDIVLENKEEKIKIGIINCNIKGFQDYYVGKLKRYSVQVNDISIFDNHKNKGYGTFILRHIPMIISDLYKCEVYRVTATTNIFKFDKYKIHDTTYSERIYSIQKWLINNNYKPNDRCIEGENGEIPVFEMDLNERETLNKILKHLENEISAVCFTTWRWGNDKHIKAGMEECNEILNKIYDSKYTIGIKEEKILGLEKIKECIIEKYNKEKEYRNEIIETIEEVKETYSTISNDELEVKKEDDFEDITIKLYCKYLNLGRTSNELYDLGYTGKNKKGEERRLTQNEIKDIIHSSETKYKELKEYAECIIIANSKII